jgi:hypothetical protein
MKYRKNLVTLEPSYSDLIEIADTINFLFKLAIDASQKGNVPFDVKKHKSHPDALMYLII